MTFCCAPTITNDDIRGAVEMRKKVLSCFMAVAAGMPNGVLAADGLTTPNVTVVGVTPLLGTGIDINKIPGNIQVVNPGAVKAENPGSVADMLDDKLGSVTTTDYVGNPLQQNLNFRGFTASPFVGESQGLAVYQNGMRLNEAFGDVVLWDMNPSFAVDRIQVLPGSNPVFGLNALGGAVALKMKDGFNNKGTSLELGGGQYGRYKATAETGQQWENIGFYTGVSAQNDDGWRKASPSNGVQTYTDIALRKGDWDVGLGITFGATSLTGNGSTPTGMLANDWSAIFTSPDLQQNVAVSTNLRLAYQISDELSAQGGAYYRHIRTALHNGNTLASTGTYTDTNGNNVDPAVYNGDIVNTTTISDSFGVSGQLSQERKIFDHDNVANVGISTDQGVTQYGVKTEAGTINADNSIAGSGIYLGGQQYSVSMGATNQYYGAYFTDTFSLTDRLHWTVSGRYNLALINLSDRGGNNTQLTSNHKYERFNPAMGFTYQINPNLTAYTSYAEANRAPTAAELGCSDPNNPCVIQTALTSDPDLKQVVSRSVELGLRGKNSLGSDASLEWNLGAYGSRNYDDIIVVYTSANGGAGYFTNAGVTERKGIEAGAEAEFGHLKMAANYGYTLATFESYNSLNSPNNPSADSNGIIQVNPGNRMPGIPLHSLKANISYAVTDRWTVGGDAKLSSQKALRGDESNSMPRIGVMNIFGLSTSYDVRKNAQLSLRIQNLFDQHYATSGTVGDPTGGVNFFTNTSANNELRVPGEPRSFWAGLRVVF